MTLPSTTSRLETLRAIAFRQNWQAGGHWVANIAEDALREIHELRARLREAEARGPSKAATE